MICRFAGNIAPCFWVAIVPHTKTDSDRDKPQERDEGWTILEPWQPGFSLSGYSWPAQATS